MAHDGDNIKSHVANTYGGLMFNIFKKSHKTSPATSVPTTPVTVTEPAAPQYTVDHITEDYIVDRCLAILNGDVTPTTGDWRFLREESGNIWNRLSEIKRKAGEADPEIAKMAYAIWLTDIAYKACCVEHLVTMAFRKAWYLNNPDEAVKDARHDLVYIGDDTCGWFSYAYHKHASEFGYPSTKQVAYLDLRDGMRPKTDWAIA